jgi:hypothetical protein
MAIATLIIQPVRMARDGVLRADIRCLYQSIRVSGGDVTSAPHDFCLRTVPCGSGSARQHGCRFRTRRRRCRTQHRIRDLSTPKQ